MFIVKTVLNLCLDMCIIHDMCEVTVYEYCFFKINVCRPVIELYFLKLMCLIVLQNHGRLKFFEKKNIMILKFKTVVFRSISGLKFLLFLNK